MATFNVKYQTIRTGKPPIIMGIKSTMVTADNMWEARQMFKYTHIDDGAVSYKIVAVIKSSK
ncbi:hypothetical protein [Treponema primitia]|uniref:hypothetical protein n=1 Tax=Treponema primitia TaxID=88058 RepID=UPI000255587E|nr:hypothetical protein [Treponema primitia]